MSERDERITRYFPYLRRLAHRVRCMVPGAEIDELVGDGALGLIRAIDRYNAARGASFERYMTRVVIGAMLNGLRKRDPVSERARRTIREADRAAALFAQECGRMPNSQEIEQRCRGILRAQQAVVRHTPLSLDAPLPPDCRILDVGEDPAQRIVAQAEHEHLVQALAHLPIRERRVLELHYHREIPLRHISVQLSVSPQRISQLHVVALARLRKALDR